jgi:DNA-binding NtrC family response regulator
MHDKTERQDIIKSVILIEDDDLLRISFEKHLKLFNYRMKKFASAEEAFQTICANEGDVIVTDFNLPGMNGIELTKAVRNRGINTPIILISAIDGKDFARVSKLHGVASVFTKPVDINEIIEEINKLCRS